jgi:hypothetical protein
MDKILGLISGSNPYILAVILAVGIGLGSFITYKIEHSAVLSMELKIANQKIEAATLLAVETSKVAVAEQTQRTLNLDLDKSREALINTSNAYSVKQSDLINSMQFSTDRKSGSNTTSKSTNPTINSTDEQEFTWVSKKLLKYLAGESVRAEQDGIDKNELMVFVIDQNCGIPK